MKVRWERGREGERERGREGERERGREGERERGRGRWGDGEMGRWGDEEMEGEEMRVRGIQNTFSTVSTLTRAVSHKCLSRGRMYLLAAAKSNWVSSVEMGWSISPV